MGRLEKEKKEGRKKGERYFLIEAGEASGLRPSVS